MPKCQAQGGQDPVAPLGALQEKQRDSGPGHAHPDPSSTSPSLTANPHQLVPGLPLGPQSFHLSGAYPEGVDAPRAPPDPAHKLSFAQLETGKKVSTHRL